MSRFKLLLMTALCPLLVGTALIASTLTVDDEADHVYGKGVHAFFDRDYEGAVTILLQAEEMESIDPRPYYFLGLAYLRQKKTEQADQYFRQAARLEYSGRAHRDYGTAESLRRIQGEERLRIEKIRSEERTNAQKREQQLQEARYGKENAAGRENLRQQLVPQNQGKNLERLQGIEDNVGANAFNVRPMDPINITEENIVVRQGNINPFGAVDVSESAEPIIVVPTPTRERERTTATPAARPGRTFANVEASPVVEVTGRNNDQSDTVVSPAALITNRTEAARAAAREVGRGLGALFSRKRNVE